MVDYEVVRLELAAQLTGLSEKQIRDYAASGKILVVRIGVEGNLDKTSLTCEMVGVREAAERAGVSEQTMRNYAKDGKVHYVTNPRNGYREFWVTDADQLRERRLPRL